MDQQLSFSEIDLTAIRNVPVFKSNNYESVFETISNMIGESDENVYLKINKGSASVYMFSSVAFWVTINSRSKYLKTGASAASGYVGKIPGVARKGDFTVIPLDIGPEHMETVAEMIRAVYEERRSAATPSSRIGCCSSFVECSDAKRCLKADDPYYNGCLYRANLEAGRIFYGKNKNI